jgi:hypothetical protein
MRKIAIEAKDLTGELSDPKYLIPEGEFVR